MSKKIILIAALILVVVIGLIFALKGNNTQTDTTATDFEVLSQQIGEDSKISQVQKGMAKAEVDELLGEATEVGLSSKGYDTFSYEVEGYVVYVFYDNEKVVEMSVTE